MKAEQKNQLMKELKFQTSRSSGKGGQHVNKTETRVELSFHVASSAALSEKEKDRVNQKLKKRINEQGELKICSSQHRSQGMNKNHVVKKFIDMLEKALLEEKKRVATTIPHQIKELIRKNKAHQSAIKQSRRLNVRDFLS